MRPCTLFFYKYLTLLTQSSNRSDDFINDECDEVISASSEEADAELTEEEADDESGIDEQDKTEPGVDYGSDDAAVEEEMDELNDAEVEEGMDEFLKI